MTLFGGGGGGQFTQRFSIDVDERLSARRSAAYAGVTWRLDPAALAYGQGGSEVLTFAPGVFRLGGNVKEAMDRNTLTGTAQLRYALTPRPRSCSAADALEDRFFSQPSTCRSERQSYRYLGGVELGERGLRSPEGSSRASATFPAASTQGSPPYRGPAVSADLALPLRRAARLRGSGRSRRAVRLEPGATSARSATATPSSTTRYRGRGLSRPAAGAASAILARRASRRRRLPAALSLPGRLPLGRPRRPPLDRRRRARPAPRRPVRVGGHVQLGAAREQPHPLLVRGRALRRHRGDHAMRPPFFSGAAAPPGLPRRVPCSRPPTRARISSGSTSRPTRRRGTHFERTAADPASW